MDLSRMSKVTDKYAMRMIEIKEIESHHELID